MIYTTEYYQNLYKKMFLACIHDKDKLINAVKGRHNATNLNLTIGDIFNAFDNEGKLKQPNESFITTENENRFAKFFQQNIDKTKTDPRDELLCDRDRFILDSIHSEIKFQLVTELTNEVDKKYNWEDRENYKENVQQSDQEILNVQQKINSDYILPSLNQIKFSAVKPVFALTNEDEIKLNDNIFIKWQSSQFTSYKNFAQLILPNKETINGVFNQLEEKAKNDFGYLQNEFPKALETIHKTIHKEINQLEDKKTAKELALKSQLFYYSLNLHLDENFSNRIKNALESNKNGDELERVFNKLPINDPIFDNFITSFFKDHITNIQIDFDSQAKIIEKTTQDRGSKSSTKEAETGSIYNKKGQLASWVADELPENTREPISQFIKDIFAKAKETVLTPEGALRQEFKDAMGQENHKKLVDMYGKDYVHNKVVNSMIMAMGGPLTSLPLQSNPSEADLAFAAITGKLLDHERVYQQKKLQELELNQPGRLTQFWQSVKRPTLETAAISMSTAGSAAAGSIAGMLIGTFAFPGIGTGLGAGIGAAVGAGVGLAASTTGVGVGRLLSQNALNRIYGTLLTTGASTGIGAGIGALLGTFVLPGVGTGIGAAIGAGFGLATGLGISGMAQILKGKSALAKLLGTGGTATAATAIGAGVGAILGTAFPIPGVGTLAGTLIGAGIGAGAGALTTVMPAGLGYLGFGVASRLSKGKNNGGSKSPTSDTSTEGSNPYTCSTLKQNTSQTQLRDSANNPSSNPSTSPSPVVVVEKIEEEEVTTPKPEDEQQDNSFTLQ